MPDLHSRLKDSRLKLGLSKHAVAKLCGVSQPTIANWERGGHVPRRGALDKLSETLQVDKNWLLSGHQPVETQAAHLHLSKPIHHIPVFQWAHSLDQFNKAKPSDYLTLSLPIGEYFAVIAKDTKVFAEDTILIMDQRGRARGMHLVSRGGQLELSEDVSDSEVLGRLIFSMQPH